MQGFVPTFSGELDSASTCLCQPGFGGVGGEIFFPVGINHGAYLFIGPCNVSSSFVLLICHQVRSILKSEGKGKVFFFHYRALFRLAITTDCHIANFVITLNQKLSKLHADRSHQQLIEMMIRMLNTRKF